MVLLCKCQKLILLSKCDSGFFLQSEKNWKRLIYLFWKHNKWGSLHWSRFSSTCEVRFSSGSEAKCAPVVACVLLHVSSRRVFVIALTYSRPTGQRRFLQNTFSRCCRTSPKSLHVIGVLNLSEYTLSLTDVRWHYTPSRASFQATPPQKWPKVYRFGFFFKQTNCATDPISQRLYI